MKKFPDQKAPFAARVYFFSIEEIRDILRSLMVKYYQACRRDKDAANEEEDNEDSVENFSDMRTVLDTFMALFSEQDGFETEDRAKGFLKDAGSDNDEDTLEKLVTYAEETVYKHTDGQDFVSVNASTPEDLLFYLQPYTFTLGGEDGQGMSAPWPLVSVIDFGLEHPLLNEGIVFVDSPGLSDANSTRAANAKSHHRKCTHKITVAEIGRAKDDKALRENLSLGFRTRGSGNTILVLTHGDSIDSDTDVTGNPLEKRREQILKDEIKALKLDKSKLNQRRQRMSREERVETETEMKTLSIATEKKLDELDALRIDMRNRSVIYAIQKQYKDLTGDPKPLSAFVVGNEAYKQHVAGFSVKTKPILTVVQTGIPSLRQRLFMLPSEGKLNDALHLATTHLPSLVNSFELYCAKTHMSRKSEIEAIILQPKEDIRQAIRNSADKLKLDVQQYILTPMRYDEREWIKGARVLCRGWNITLYMLKRNGHRKGRKKLDPDMSWNGELNTIRRGAMEDYFGQLQNAVIPHFDEVKRKFYSMLYTSKSKIRSKTTACHLVFPLRITLTMSQRIASSTSWHSISFWRILAQRDRMPIDASLPQSED